MVSLFSAGVQTEVFRNPIYPCGKSRRWLETFYQGLHPGALATGDTLVKEYGLSSYQRLLDVGGGSGGVAIGAVKACPHIQATVVDVSNVTPITQRFVTAAGVSERVAVITGNIVKSPIYRIYSVRLSGVLSGINNPYGIQNKKATS